MLWPILPLWAGDFIGIFNIAIIFALYGAVLVFGLWLPGSGSTSASNAFTVLYGVLIGFFGVSIVLSAISFAMARVSHGGRSVKTKV